MRSEDESEKIARGIEPPTSEVVKAARKISGTLEIDVRAGFEQGVRDATENALKCYRDAAKARAAGDALEAYGLCEIAERSLDTARDLLVRLEGLA